MGVTRRIPQDQLTGYFGDFTRRFLRDQSAETVDVEVLALEWGDQFAAHGNRLLGITYDSHANTLDFELSEGDHRVFEPQEVWTVEEPDGFVSAVQVVRPDGTRDVAQVHRVDTRERDSRK